MLKASSSWQCLLNSRWDQRIIFGEIDGWAITASKRPCTEKLYVLVSDIRFEPYERIWKSWSPPKKSLLHVAGGT